MLEPRLYFFFFFNDTATTEIYTLSLHDALPIFLPNAAERRRLRAPENSAARDDCAVRSEEHTSELQSHHDLVCRLLLEKKKRNTITTQASVTCHTPTTPSPLPHSTRRAPAARST